MQTDPWQDKPSAQSEDDAQVLPAAHPMSEHGLQCQLEDAEVVLSHRDSMSQSLSPAHAPEPTGVVDVVLVEVAAELSKYSRPLIVVYFCTSFFDCNPLVPFHAPVLVFVPEPLPLLQTTSPQAVHMQLLLEFIPTA